MTYIYLNTYQGGYLYVGSHTWNGEGIDPNYKGSSKVANHFGWKPIKILLLEICGRDKFKRETYWIEKYASEYGIADCALQLRFNSWTSKYKPHGLLLNCHSNTCEQAYKKGHPNCMSPEVRSLACKKAAQTQRCKGVGLGAVQSKESYQKGLKFRVENGSFERWQKSIRSKEAIQKKDYQSLIKKSMNTKKSRVGIPGYNTVHRVNCYKDAILLYSNLPVRTICTKLGNSNWSCTINRKFMNGANEVSHHGYKFIII